MDEYRLRIYKNLLRIEEPLYNSQFKKKSKTPVAHRTV